MLRVAGHCRGNSCGGSCGCGVLVVGLQEGCQASGLQESAGGAAVVAVGVVVRVLWACNKDARPAAMASSGKAGTAGGLAGQAHVSARARHAAFGRLA